MTLRYPGAFRTGLIVLSGLALLVVFAVLVNLSFGLPFNLNLWPPGQAYSLRASFKDANGVQRGADVVISGHPIGQVTGVSVVGQEAEVMMRISPQYAPVHRGSIARIRYSTLLAQKYIELTTVSRSNVIPSGGRIPSDETVTPVDFDQFLSTFDDETRARLQVVIQQAGSGLEGRQAAINDLLDQLNGLAIESKPPLDAIKAHDANLDRIVGNLAITADRLAQSHENLGQLVQNANTVNARLADQDAALAQLIHHLADLMTDFNQTLDGNEDNLHQTVVQLDPLLGQLNVATGAIDAYLGPSLPAIADEIGRLGPEGESAIHQRDANGNYLRQYLVVDPACDKINSTADAKCDGPAR